MSREAILKRIANNKPDALPLPASVDFGITYESTLEQFKMALEAVHADVLHFDNQEAFVEAFPSLYPDARIVYSPIDKLCSFTATEPNLYKELELSIYPAKVGVAENAALFVDFSEEEHRSQATLAVNLCLIVNKADLVNNMHEAYAKLGTLPDYGVFISGPSKTADIEQSLVIGAHGACTLRVIILG